MPKKTLFERRSRLRRRIDQPRRILVVDDNFGHITSVSDILEKAGYEVRSESKVEHGLRAAKEERFDIVLMGYRFDDSAVTMTSVIGEFAREASVIMLTGFEDQTIEEDALLLGAGAFLVKPVTAAVLLRTIKRLLTLPYPLLRNRRAGGPPRRRGARRAAPSASASAWPSPGPGTC